MTSSHVEHESSYCIGHQVTVLFPGNDQKQNGLDRHWQPLLVSVFWRVEWQPACFGLHISCRLSPFSQAKCLHCTFAATQTLSMVRVLLHVIHFIGLLILAKCEHSRLNVLFRTFPIFCSLLDVVVCKPCIGLTFQGLHSFWSVLLWSSSEDLPFPECPRPFVASACCAIFFFFF